MGELIEFPKGRRAKREARKQRRAAKKQAYSDPTVAPSHSVIYDWAGSSPPHVGAFAVWPPVITGSWLLDIGPIGTP